MLRELGVLFKLYRDVLVSNTYIDFLECKFSNCL